MRLEGRVALVTGGASGIGRAAALRLAREGASVVVADLDEAAGAETVSRIEAEGHSGSALFVRCDVTREEEVRAAVKRAGERYGALQVLITCAGILQGAFQPVEELALETFERVLSVNVLGTFLFCKHATPLLEASGSGVVLCVASGGGVRGPSSSLAYGASKAAVHGFCLTLERQLEPRGIRVNVVCPGSLDTPMKRQNIRDGARTQGLDPEQALAAARLGDPDGVARVLAFLASEDAGYLVGTVFTK
jgi:NAD(P)-dependent dehydrogenase (short-subunit alcohol dehydrogenase family)